MWFLSQPIRSSKVTLYLSIFCAKHRFLHFFIYFLIHNLVIIHRYHVSSITFIAHMPCDTYKYVPPRQTNAFSIYGQPGRLGKHVPPGQTKVLCQLADKYRGNLCTVQYYTLVTIVSERSARLHNGNGG